MRLLGIPSNIYEVPKELLPNIPNLPDEPLLALATQGIVGFQNLGKKGPSDMKTLTLEDYKQLPKEDVTSYATLRDQPRNEFIIGGNPPWLVRTQTVLLKLEVMQERYTVFGDPYLWTSHTTSHSVAPYKLGEVLSP